MLAFPLLVRRVGAERLLVLGGLAFAARAGLWALTSEPLLFVAIAPLGGIGYALFYVGTVTYVSRAVPPSVQATAQGLFSGTAFSIGTILGAVIGGQIAAALTIPGMFAVSAAGDSRRRGDRPVGDGGAENRPSRLSRTIEEHRPASLTPRPAGSASTHLEPQPRRRRILR